jgi:hypothetical protein
MTRKHRVRETPGYFRILAAAILAAAVCCAGAAPALSAAELLMFETRACEWCEQWREDVGVVYPKTPEGRAAPLRRVDLDAPRPADLAGVANVIYTPTFVLFDQGREVGRILGYPGEAHFWGLLGVLLQKLETGPSN